MFVKINEPVLIHSSWQKSIHYPDLFSFYLMSFFCPRIPSRAPYDMNSHVSLGLSQLWQFFKLYLFFFFCFCFLMNVAVLQTAGQVFCRKSLGLDLSDFFFSFVIGAVGWGRLQLKCCSHYIVSRGQSINRNYYHVGVKLGHLDETMCFSFFYSEVTLCPLSMLYSLKGGHSAQTTLKKHHAPPPWGQRIFINYFKFFSI